LILISQQQILQTKKEKSIMSITQELQEFQTRTKDLDKSAFLGSVVWFSTSDCDIQYTSVVNALTRSGLASMAPRPPCDADVFKRTFWAGTHRNEAATEDGIIERLMVRHVSLVSPTKEVPGRIVRKVVSEFVDAEKLSLAYPSQGGGEVVFNYETGSVAITPYDESTPQAENLLHDLRRQYDRTRGCLDGSALRGIITRTLDAAKAVNLRGKAGGVYLLSMSHEDVVASLETWTEVLRRDLSLGVDFHSLPLLDDLKQREMVLDGVREDISQDVKALTVDVTEALQQNEGVTMRRFASASAKLQALQAKASEYESLLKHEGLVAETSLGMLALQVQALFGLVK